LVIIGFQKGGVVKKKRFSEEQVAFAPRQAETGTSVQEVVLKMGISEATLYNWRQKYSELGISELRRLFW
jgi:putative transposase